MAVAGIEHRFYLGHALPMWQGGRNLRENSFIPIAWRWFTVSPALPIAAMFLIACAYFGSNRDFGSFLLAIPILAVLFIGVFFGALWPSSIKAARGHSITAIMLICLSPAAYLCSYGITQHIRFFFWAPAHYRQLAEASKKSGIIMGWDSWGMAGQDTSSYLVVDTEDQLGSKSRADQWTKQIGQSCGFWEEQRVWPKLYIVTTYTNCPYDGIEPAQ